VDPGSFGKLVHDNISIGIKSGGERVFEARLAADDALPGLFVKLIEEGQELLSAGNKTSQAEEIADLLEVVREIATQAGIRGRGYPNRRTQAATQRRI
jgi:predicted house-cleaning noncanonical NTP pyrophosphatase (MazG superfamily)